MIRALSVHADIETPVSCFLKLAEGHPHAFLFESVEGREKWADYSVLGYGARRIFRHENGKLEVTGTDRAPKTYAEADPLRAIQSALDESPLVTVEGAPPFVGGIFGYLSYEAVRHFEPTALCRHPPEVPDAFFVEFEVLAVFDNRHHSLTLYAQDDKLLLNAAKRLEQPIAPPTSSGSWQTLTARTDAETFKKGVRTLKEHIHQGNIIQAVLSRRFESPRSAPPFQVYRGLRKINPSPYMYFWRAPEFEIAGASPEVMVRVKDGQVVLRPIAGTRPRSGDADTDAKRAEELLADPKERAEHIMLIDLGRNDLGRISQPGTVQVTDCMVVENYSHVMHIVSEVTGRLKPGLSPFDALRATFPAGTLSGAPKVRAMQLIDEHEPHARGIYGGAVGYFGPGGADFGIAIRTMVAFPDRFVVQAGAGIVADSDPDRECEETEHKAQAVMRAMRWAAQE